MIRKVCAAAAVTMIVALLTGCSGSTQEKSGETASPTPSVSVETTVRIDGQDWTCEAITASEPQQCGEFTQQVFDQYGDNIDTYVNSEQLGPLNAGNGFTYEDAAFAGLVACAYMLDKRGQNDYIDYMMTEEPFKSTLDERVEYLPAWLAAPTYLCPGLTPPIQNPGSSRIP